MSITIGWIATSFCTFVVPRWWNHSFSPFVSVFIIFSERQMIWRLQKLQPCLRNTGSESPSMRWDEYCWKKCIMKQAVLHDRVGGNINSLRKIQCWICPFKFFVAYYQSISSCYTLRGRRSTFHPLMARNYSQREHDFSISLFRRHVDSLNLNCDFVSRSVQNLCAERRIHRWSNKMRVSGCTLDSLFLHFYLITWCELFSSLTQAAKLLLFLMSRWLRWTCRHRSSLRHCQTDFIVWI